MPIILLVDEHHPTFLNTNDTSLYEILIDRHVYLRCFQEESRKFLEEKFKAFELLNKGHLIPFLLNVGTEIYLTKNTDGNEKSQYADLNV